MVARLVANVAGDRFVAILAQTGLLAAFEADMAIVAVGFQVSMPGDDFARHDGRFNALCVGIGRAQPG